MASASVLSHATSSPWQDSSAAAAFDSAYGRRSGSHDIYIHKNGSGRPQPLRSMTSVPSGYVSRHGKLHRRNDSGSSLLSANSTMSLAAKNDHFSGVHSVASTKIRSTDKLKPYLRKMSLRDDDEEQGRIDLSRPSGEHDASSYNGLSELSETSQSASDVSFLPSSRRRVSHRRAISLSSPLSTHSTTLRPTQSFIQPKRRPSQQYTPPPAFANSTLPPSEDEMDESVDILTDDLRRTSIERWRSRRAISTGSTPTQNYSAASLTKLANGSQSNLSTRSANSNNSGQEIKIGPSRRNTSMSLDLGTNTSSRTSMDRAVSFLSRTSEPEDPASRAANIRALRRAFEEKEAAKERKLEEMEMKRRNTAEMKRSKKEEKDRRKSVASDEKIRRRRSTKAGPDPAVLDEKFSSTEYPRNTPVSHLGHDGEAGMKVKTEISKTKAARSHWVRFRAWSRTRMLSCY